MYGFNHTDPELAFARMVELGTFAQFTNHWEAWMGGGYRFAILDDRETRGGLPYPRQPEGFFWLGVKTNSTRQVYAETTFIFAQEEEATYYEVNGAIKAALWDRFNCTLYGKYSHGRGYPRWIETLEQGGRDRYIFGDLNMDQLDLRLTALLGITRVLTFQVFVQLLYSMGTYGDEYRELYPLDDGTGALGPTTYDSNADYASLTMQANAILRWDLGAGAAAYLVYKMAGSLDRSGRPIDFDLGPDLEDMLDEEQSHLLLLKLSYGWDI